MRIKESKYVHFRHFDPQGAHSYSAHVQAHSQLKARGVQWRRWVPERQVSKSPLQRRSCILGKGAEFISNDLHVTYGSQTP